MHAISPPFSCPSPFARQTGSSLIEVLVSVFVLTFGFLGAAGLQIASLRSAESSLERSQAVFLSHTILDAMRANMENASSTPLDLSILKVKTAYSTGAAGTATLCDATTIGTSDAVATADLEFWIENLQSNLGKGTCGGVYCDGNLCTVTISWDDSRGDSVRSGGSAPTIFISRSQL
ncbi:MAG: type IV pilus modification protein PilV [Azoarcus sp.]|jgi:type IV pilus assembly protein PilV|nr:type IV pilus modification protein PilV [Azoarcus sp.]